MLLIEVRLGGNDVFVSLPTGYCKLLLPRIFDFVRGAKNKSIVVVVSSLTALMKDQVISITEMGLSAAVISDKESTPSTVKNRIKNGDFKLLLQVLNLCGRILCHQRCTEII